MRILIIVHGYPPTHNGGAERRAERTARGLQGRGHDVRVFCFESPTAPDTDLHQEDCVQNGVTVRRLYFDPAAAPAPFRWSYDNPATGEALESLIQAWHPDVVHLFGGYLMSASIVRVAVAHNVRVVVSLTDYWWLCHRINLIRTNGTRCDGPTPTACARCQAETFRRYRLPARVWPQAADTLWSTVRPNSKIGVHLGVPQQNHRATTLLETLHSADVLIAPSRYLADFYIRHGINPAQIRVWRQGVELDYCLLRKPDPALRIGYIGQIKHHKGVHLLLDAWSRLQSNRPRRLELYGSDHGEEAYGHQIRQTIRKLEHVTWHGQFHGGEVWSVLANLDVLVAPSRWVENSPNTILEAQAVGIPVIGSNLGGIAELVQHEQNGLLFEVDNPADLARQLQRLLDEPDLVQRLQHAENPFLSHQDSLDQVDGLYGELVAQPRERLAATALLPKELLAPSCV